jgi:D-psicose/D-tagatose/L-ribulose 3-epimerase
MKVGIFRFVSIAAALVIPAAAPTPEGRRHVQIGYCTRLNNLAAAKAAGFDYAELATTEVTGLSDAEFEQAAHNITTLAVPTPVANLFLPAAIKVTGPEIDRPAQNAYAVKAFDRLSRLGVTTVVFGSGGARRVPEGFPRDEAVRQLVEFGRVIAPLARARGLTVAVEPLRHEETNIINNAREGLELVQAVNDPAFELMVDFYHLAGEREDPGIIVRAREHLRHVHIANPNGRVFPLRTDEFEYEPFFAALRAIDYHQRISVEASTTDLERDAPRAIAFLRSAF